MQRTPSASSVDGARNQPDALDEQSSKSRFVGGDQPTQVVTGGLEDRLLGAPALQAQSAASKMIGCLLQAGSAPFKLMWNYPRATVALFATAANVVAQSCMYGTPGFQGAPQQHCNDAAKAMMDNKAVVTGMAGTLFALSAHMVTDAVSRFRANRAEVEADATTAVRAAV